MNRSLPHMQVTSASRAGRSANIEVTRALSAQLAGVARLFTDAPYFHRLAGLESVRLLAAGTGFLAYTNGRAVVRYALGR